MFVHSAKSGGDETRGTWRQAHTALDLKPGGKASYGFRMQWASSYDDLRNILYENGLFDVRVVPGMTVPSDLSAKFSLRTKARIESVTAEFPADTALAPATSSAGSAHVYDVTFRRLGENMLTITHDGGRKTYLEFFVTEPMETLIKKRAAFLVNRQQIRDPTKWWNGVYAIYDQKAKKIRTIDDPDIFLDRMVYALTCDDPGLAKAPFLASKNVTFPDKKEIESLEYYIKNFVWGGLQRKDDERPYPYGVYGTPNWYVNRDPKRREAYANAIANGATAKADLNKEHVWRSYDYPHVIMLYFHMYQIAKQYPELSTYLDAAGYLNARVGNRTGVLHLSVRDLPVVLRHVQVGSLQRARRARCDRRAQGRGPSRAGQVADRRVGEEGQVFRLRRSVSVPIGVRLRSHRLRVHLRVREVRRHARHGAG